MIRYVVWSIIFVIKPPVVRPGFILLTSDMPYLTKLPRKFPETDKPIPALSVWFNQKRETPVGYIS